MGPKKRKTSDDKENGVRDEKKSNDNKSEVTDPEGERVDTDDEDYELAIRMEMNDLDDADSSLRRSKRIRTKVPTASYDGVFKIPSKPPVRYRTRNNTGMMRSPLNKRKKKDMPLKPQDVTTFPGNCDLPMLMESLSSNGTTYQVGDIASLVDDDYNVYYCMIRALLMDKFCEKSAVITWLLCTRSSLPPNQGFDPWTYLIGPDEELPRRLEHFEFVMHNPGGYYSPKPMFPKPHSQSQREFMLHYFKDMSYHKALKSISQ
uniref:GATA zinc finger domain-containing protein 1 n=1 Tax=Cacopsylla melanoneura TaxID=428564 RepID=A0A8D8LQT4_9HEMI